MSGQGQYQSVAGTVYDGTFANNRFMDGTCTFSNLTGSYQLVFVDGTPSTAEIVFSDGSEYTGQCDPEGICGKGSLKFANGDEFTGSFERGVRNGQGTYTWLSGAKYDGEWSSDKMDGSGKYTYANGCYLNGTFRENQFSDGVFFLANDFGSYSFSVQNQEVYAVDMKLADGTTYSGALRDGQLTGTAQIKYSNGDTYSGSVTNGVKSGSGVYKWANGASYDGSWSEDQMNGRGTYFYPSGESGYKITGSFVNGMPDGECRYYVSASESYKTDWVKGKCKKVYE